MTASATSPETKEVPAAEEVKAAETTQSENQLPQGGFGRYGKKIGIGLGIALAMLVPYLIFGGGKDEKDSAQPPAKPTGTVANAPAPAPSATATASPHQSVLPQPPQGFHHIRISGIHGPMEVYTQSENLGLQVSSNITTIAMNQDNAAHAQKLDQIRRELDSARQIADSQEQRLKQAENQLNRNSTFVSNPEASSTELPRFRRPYPVGYRP